MTRVLVLVLCLASAATIAAYTYLSSERPEPTAVYVVRRAPETRPEPPLPAVKIDPNDRVALARALQRELKRVGCYSGEITGVWTTSSRMAMRAFTERVNATLPIDRPDPVLLSLVQGHRESDACTPDAEAAKDAKASGPDEVEAAKEKANPVPAAALALTPPAAKAAPKASPDAADGVRPATVRPAPREERTRDKDARDKDKKALVDASKAGPVPPAGIREKRPRRSDQPPKPQPPKVVRDVLKALGF
jgi:hypothetical protein